jgi:hypothetical protein
MGLDKVLTPIIIACHTIMRLTSVEKNASSGLHYTCMFVCRTNDPSEIMPTQKFLLAF